MKTKQHPEKVTWYLHTEDKHFANFVGNIIKPIAGITKLTEKEKLVLQGTLIFGGIKTHHRKKIRDTINITEASLNNYIKSMKSKGIFVEINGSTHLNAHLQKLVNKLKSGSPIQVVYQYEYLPD